MSIQQTINHDVASPETLAGIYVCIEGPEEVFVAAGRNKPSQAEMENRRVEPSNISGIPISVDEKRTD